MPFGLVRAPRTFQRMMDKVIQGLEYQMALCYIDDVIVYGPTLDICMDRMQVVLERVRNAKLKFKAKKCILFSSEVKFLGHVISKHGTKTSSPLPTRSFSSSSCFLIPVSYTASRMRVMTSERSCKQQNRFVILKDTATFRCTFHLMSFRAENTGFETAAITSQRRLRIAARTKRSTEAWSASLQQTFILVQQYSAQISRF